MRGSNSGGFKIDMSQVLILSLGGNVENGAKWLVLSFLLDILIDPSKSANLFGTVQILTFLEIQNGPKEQRH